MTLIALCLIGNGHQAWSQSPLQFQDKQGLRNIIEKLTSAEFAGRASKTEGARKAAEYLSNLFREAGLRPMTGNGSNVAAMIEGKTRKDEFVIVSAHYDGFGGQFTGAMDNAAGVALMIEAARALSKNPPDRSVLFIAFDGGEQNNAGAKYYADNPPVPLGKTVAAINLSGFGGGFGDQLHETLYIIGAEHSPQLAETVGKHKRGVSHLALIGGDATRFIGGEHFNFALGQIPAITITNGVHYAYHTKADVAGRINFPALEKHSATIAKLVAEIADSPGSIERAEQPSYDADEASEWLRLLTALRENLSKTSANNAGLAQIDDVILELKRFRDRAVADPKARQAVIHRAASICFYIANPNGVEYNTLLSAARRHEQNGDRQQAIVAYQKLLRYIENEYRRDDQIVREIRLKLAELK